MKRHRWTSPVGVPGLRAIREKGPIAMEKTCQDCGLYGRRFGVGRESYWKFWYRDEPVVVGPYSEQPTPPCRP